MFQKLLVANRGEIALRVIRACRKLGVKTVAAYSEADAASPHLEEADQRVCLGPGPASASYLNQDALLQAALQTECQALHPGYGFLSENARFSARCAQQKLTFVGPPAKAIALMGDKVTARDTMARLGVFGVPGSQGLLRDVDEALRVAAQVGYPVLLKATAGGGGKGMRVCRGPEDLPQAFEQARLEAEKAFGNGGLYAERFVEGGRHIEFQVMADRYGRVVHFGERECSTQRSNQKLIEEAPSACVSAAQRDEVGRRLCEAISRMGYVGAGTVEFLRAPTGELFFMEMNTRLQVEHPVTELVTGVDLVELQLRMAAGEPLRIKQEDVTWKGHAVECRINAEDPAHNFRPSPGTLTGFGAPEAWRYNFEGPVRLDSHARAGYRIPTFYDSMIGKLIAWGPDRDSAIARLRSALGQLHIEGVPTTVPLHDFLLQDPGFAAGEYSMSSMGEAMKRFMASREA